MEKRKLGTSDLEVTPIGLGCWQFSKGKGLVGKFWPVLSDETVLEIVRTAIDFGIDWFDTAEIYGHGASEKALSNALHSLQEENDKTYIIATKWWPLFRTASSISTSFADRLQSLNVKQIDLHQIHQPFSFSSIHNQMKEMANLYHQGNIRAIGVSNFNESQMRKAHRTLREYDIPLATNQVKYSLLDRRIERNGILQAAKELQITIIAYSPLEQGLLTGKFHDDSNAKAKLKGPRRFSPAFGAKNLEKIRPLIEELSTISKQYDATPAQVALNWLIHYHGTSVVAIPGASKASHVEDHARTMQFQLTEEELQRINLLSMKIAK